MRKPVTIVVTLLLVGLCKLAWAGFPAKECYLPSVAVGPGSGTSNWYTTVWVHNPTTSSVNARFEFLERDKSNINPTYVFNDTIPAGDTKRYPNALVTLFGITDRKYGAIRVVASEPVIVNGRIYSKDQSAMERDSVGQFFAAIPVGFAIGPGESTAILGVAQTSPQSDSEFRYNFGFVEVGGGNPLVEVVAFNEVGDRIMTKAYPVQPFEAKQVSLTNLIPAPQVTNGRLQVSVLSNSTGKVVAFGSGVANRSNDPSTFEMSFKDELLAVSGGAFTLPYSGNANSGSSAFKVANTGAGAAMEATGASGFGLRATTQTGLAGVAGVAGTPSGMGLDGVTGVWGDTIGGIGVSGTSKEAIGVVGYGGLYGVLGEAISGVGVVGSTSADTGVTVGVSGTSHSDRGIGVAGDAMATTGENYGVRGTTNSPMGAGVYGKNEVSGGVGVRGEGLTGGMFGTASETGGFAVMGGHTVSQTLGLLATSYHGAYGKADTTKGGTVGVYGLATSGGGVGVGATNIAPQEGTVGVFGNHSVPGGQGAGVHGVSVSSTGVGGRFFNTGGGTGLLGGSTTGSLLELYQVTSSGSTTNRVFVVGIVGDVYSDGSFNCGRSSACFNSGSGADLAERIDVAEELEPGDVVEIDPDATDRFRRSRGANSRLVAGVVSTKPAMTMNNNDLADNLGGVRREARPLLALVGKVRVKATSENGAIGIGDLLVSAAKPGHVMRADATPTAGTVVGKALESLGAGSNSVLMLVMLR